MPFAARADSQSVWKLALGVTLFLAVQVARPGVGGASGEDWPNWRGPQQDRTSSEVGLIDRWDPAGGPGSNLLWKRTELGGRSTPIVMDGRLYTLVRDQPGTAVEGEKVVCVDAATGNLLWEHRCNVYLTDVPDTRVGWSSVCGDPATGRVYALSVSGYFFCLEGKTGDLVWDRSLHEEFGLLSTYGGRTHSPLVFEDTVLIGGVIIGWGDAPQWGFLAKPAHRFLCFDKATGELRWLKGTGIPPDDTTYSTPTITTLGGQAAMVFGSGEGMIRAFQPRTGAPIWHYPLSRRGVNVSPLVVGDTVYASHSEENPVGNTMGSVVALDGTMTGDLTGKEKWRAFEVMAGKASPVLVENRLWVVDDRAKLSIFDAQSGERVAKKALGTVMRGTPLYADGKVYCATHNGRWYILQPTERGVQVLHKLRLDGEACDGSPIAAGGRVYLPTSAALYCLGTTQAQPTQSTKPHPSHPEDPEDPEDPEESEESEESEVPEESQGETVPALVQLVPCDAIVAPGESVTYDARIYNARGQLLEVQPNVKTVIAPTESKGHEAVLIEAQIGALQGTARLRIVPPLPWRFDFNSGDKVPLTWVGGRVRWVPQLIEGERVAVKRSVLPTPSDPNNKLGTRSRMWMGPVALSNYTIQADFALQRNAESGKMPDFGLINSRYTMTVRSSNRELRLYSWSPHEVRTFASVPFDPLPGEWYTMKLEVHRSTIRGKLWVRGEAEPAAWTVAMEDDSPNLSGSPGLYGNAQEAEIYVDNLTVVVNEPRD